MRPLLAFLLLLTGCIRMMPTPIPMGSIADPLPTGGKAKCLLVLLPGAADHAEVFREEGLVEQIQRAGLSIDLVAADATPGYYFKGIMPLRLETDVVAPARAKGYEQVWLLGISIGGFGTFLYSREYPEHVDGVAALAPFLGDETVLQSIRDAGGLAKWKAPEVQPIDKDNFGEQLWGWLRRVAVDRQPGPDLYLGYGEDDDLAKPNAILAAVLAPSHVFHVPGGHAWEPWRQLLQRFLQASDFKDRCGR